MSSEPFDYGYGIIIDAGSSGSRIYLYRWPKVEQQDSATTTATTTNDQSSSSSSSTYYTKVEPKSIYYDERSIGISSEVGGLEALQEIIISTKNALPKDAIANDIPIYLGATAGMRLSNGEDDDGSSSSTKIMDDVRLVLSKSGFRFDKNEWARMISGDEESVYGWLVANYLKDGSLPNNGDDNGNNNNSEAAPTYGALDLGGGSTQISCLAPMPTTPETFPLVIGNMEYQLYTRSYLYYGADQARERHDTKFVTTPSSSIGGSRLLKSASKKDKANLVNPCYPIGYTHPETNIAGSSNWDECFDSVAELFTDESREHPNLRGGVLLDVIVPPPITNTDNNQQQRFIAMSVFVFIWDFLGLETGPATHDLTTLKLNARKVCTLSHDEQMEQYDVTMVNNQHPPSRKTNKAYAQCFNAAYAYHLLHKGYGMDVVDTPIEVYYEINGGKVNWALGMMLVEANNLDHHGTFGNGVRGVVDAYYGTVSGGESAAFLFLSLILAFWLLFRRFPQFRRLLPKRKSSESKGEN